MRVVGGVHKGRKLNAPEGKHTRPTTDRVKEALFGAIQFRIAGARVLDLFAGSGALGIEALSRGADTCVFVESSRAAQKALEANLAWVAPDYRVMADDYLAALKWLDGERFDLILIDPPYAAGYYIPALAYIAENGLLAEGGLLVLEIKTGMQSGGQEYFSLMKKKTYGEVTLEFYESRENG